MPIRLDSYIILEYIYVNLMQTTQIASQWAFRSLKKLFLYLNIWIYIYMYTYDNSLTLIQH